MPRYADRTMGRRIAFQFLFTLEFVDTPWTQALTEFWLMNPTALTDEACEPDEITAAKMTGLKDADADNAKVYAETLITGVCESREMLDARIAAALDNWTPERVGRIEWVIIRLALYELLACDDTPATVVIAEAVQLANIFGDAQSPRFVNGLLDKLSQGNGEGDADDGAEDEDDDDADTAEYPAP